MRLLLVSQDFPPRRGGIETYCREVAARLSRVCEAVHVLCPAHPRSGRLDAQQPFTVHRVGGGGNLLPVLAAPAIARLVVRHQIEVLFHAQWQTAGVGALLRKRGRVGRLAIAVHGKELLLSPLHRAPALQRAYDRGRRRVLEAADVLLPVSSFSRNLLPTASLRERCITVPNGVDAGRFATGDGDRFRRQWGLGDDALLLTVARLVSRKGIDRVIEALSTLRHELPGVRYVVVGRGPDKARLQRLAQGAGLAGRVHFLENVSDDELPDAYAAADAFVLAARDEPQSVEGFGLVLLEAGAAGKPVVATAAGGMADAVVHERTGLLVPPEAPGALAAALRRVLTDGDFGASLGRGGQLHATGEGSWDTAAGRIYAALEGTAPR